MTIKETLEVWAIYGGGAFSLWAATCVFTAYMTAKFLQHWIKK
jgi:hypothetical protein